MEKNRKNWNLGQQNLRRELVSGSYKKAVGQFLTQHAMVHSKMMSHTDVWSFEDELWQGLNDADTRTVPPGGEHSIAWILFHIARIEDIAMNLLIAGTPQRYRQGKWANRLNSTIHHSANKMDDDSVVRLSSEMDIDALREYRLSVGRRTREIVRLIQPDEFRKKVDPARLEKVLKEGALIKEAMEIIHYWGNRTIAGLLLMPPTRHNFLHLNEALRIKQKLGR